MKISWKHDVSSHEISPWLPPKGPAVLTKTEMRGRDSGQLIVNQTLSMI